MILNEKNVYKAAPCSVEKNSAVAGFEPEPLYEHGSG